MRGFAEAERVGRPHTRWHYSNLTYAVLGQVVEKLDGRPWYESLEARLLRPLEMSRTTVGFVDDGHVTGYFVPPFHDVPRPEPVLELKAMAAVGGLASTARDLARWSAFVAAPDAEVLSPDTLEEMCQPQVLTDVDRWTTGMGLGFFVHRSASGRTWVGHDGGMPGHSTALLTHRESGTGRHRPDEQHLVARPDGARDQAGRPRRRRRPRRGGAVAAGHVGARGAGRHHRPVVLRGPRLHLLGARGPARGPPDGAPAARAPSVFVADGPDRFRTVSGRERGELLRVTRDDAGRVDRLHWATYLFTREPLGFGEHHG